MGGGRPTCSGLAGRLLQASARSVLVVGLVTAGGCGPRDLRAGSEDALGDDELVLEFGGDDTPVLRERLAARGWIASETAGAPAAEAASGAGDSTAAQPADTPPADAQRDVRRDDRSIGLASAGVLELREGDTLSELCARELGSARWWRRVAEFNGWSEQDTLRLRPGTEVRVPPDLRERATPNDG